MHHAMCTMYYAMHYSLSTTRHCTIHCPIFTIPHTLRPHHTPYIIYYVCTAVANTYSQRYAENQDASPLLRLPAELRLKIFEHVFAVPVIRVGDKSIVKPRWKYSKTQLSLLGVCRQIYHEARTLTFSVNTFRGWSGKVDAAMFNHMLEWQIANITTVRLYTEKMDLYRDPDLKLREWFLQEVKTICELPRLKNMILMWYDHKFLSIAEGLFTQTEEVLRLDGRTDISLMVQDCDPCKEYVVGPDKTELAWNYNIECSSELVLM